jgi:6-phosphofructokinase 1
MVNRLYVHIPMRLAVTSRAKVDAEGALWRDAVEATHQPFNMKNGS